MWIVGWLCDCRVDLSWFLALKLMLWLRYEIITSKWLTLLKCSVAGVNVWMCFVLQGKLDLRKGADGGLDKGASHWLRAQVIRLVGILRWFICLTEHWGSLQKNAIYCDRMKTLDFDFWLLCCLILAVKWSMMVLLDSSMHVITKYDMGWTGTIIWLWRVLKHGLTCKFITKRDGLQYLKANGSEKFNSVVFHEIPFWLYVILYDGSCASSFHGSLNHWLVRFK